MLEFYGTRIEYHGEELGIYKSRDETPASVMLPEYAICDVFVFENIAREVSKERFVEELKKLREIAVKQAGADVCAGSPVLRPTNLENKRQSLTNTRDFVDKVLTALGGK